MEWTLTNICESVSKCDFLHKLLLLLLLLLLLHLIILLLLIHFFLVKSTRKIQSSSRDTTQMADDGSGGARVVSQLKKLFIGRASDRHVSNCGSPVHQVAFAQAKVACIILHIVWRWKFSLWSQHIFKLTSLTTTTR